MGFRNPVTSAVDQTARDAAANALNVATNGIIPGSRLAADAIDGRSITGVSIHAGSLDTGASPSVPGLSVSSGSIATALQIRDGTTDTPAQIRLLTSKNLNTGAPLVNDLSVTGAAVPQRGTDLPFLLLRSSGSGSASTLATLHADAINFEGQVNGADLDWVTATLKNGWAPYGAAGYPPVVRFRKLSDGDISVQGMVKGGTLGAGVAVFTLPAAGGYLPTSTLLIPVLGNNALGRVDVQANGDVCIVLGSSAAYTSLNFRFTPG